MPIVNIENTGIFLKISIDDHVHYLKNDSFLAFVNTYSQEIEFQGSGFLLSINFNDIVDKLGYDSIDEYSDYLMGNI